MLVFHRINFSCSSSSNSVSMMIRSSSNWFSQVHPVQNSWERASLSEPSWTMWGSGKNLGEHPYSHWSQHSGCNQHALCVGHFHTFSVWAAPATPQCQACEQHTRWHVYVQNRMPFACRRMPYRVSCWRHRTFLVNGVQWIWYRWCCTRAWSQTACQQCALTVKGSSQPPSLEPSWPGLTIWGIDNSLAQGRCPCPCRGRRWYSPPIQYGFPEMDDILDYITDLMSPFNSKVF